MSHLRQVMEQGTAELKVEAQIGDSTHPCLQLGRKRHSIGRRSAGFRHSAGGGVVPAGSDRR